MSDKGIKSARLRGPDVGVDWSGRNGFPCTCYWSRGHWGDTCPEHGKVGVPVPTREEELEAEVARLRGQHAGLHRRIDLLEAENARYRDAVGYTLRTLDLCRDPAANPLAKMCDRATAEEKLRAALARPAADTPEARAAAQNRPLPF